MVENRRVKEPSRASVLFKEYCESSSVHGVQFFVKENFRYVERLLWALFVYSSALGMIYLQSLVIMKYLYSPVLVTLSNNLKPVYEVPFPTVTICPHFKADKKNLDDAKSELLAHIMRDETHSENKNLLRHLESIEAYEELSPRNKSYTLTWKGKSNSFDSWDVTDDGLCFTFNKMKNRDMYRDDVRSPLEKLMYDRDVELDWDLENGYKENTHESTYPKRLLYGNSRHSLEIKIKTWKNYTNPKQFVISGKGHKVILTVPGNAIQTFQNFIDVPTNHRVSIALKPVFIQADKSIRNYNGMNRFCHFGEERYLRYFKHYSQENCEYECLINSTQHTCQCLKFSMPRPTTCVIECNATAIDCYEKELHNFYHGSEGDVCNCLPGCFSLSYDASVTQTKSKNEDKVYDVSVLNIYFASNDYQSSVRTELYGITDLIANIGGIMGLFLGISGVSFVEMLYFLTNRWFSNSCDKAKSDEL